MELVFPNQLLSMSQLVHYYCIYGTHTAVRIVSKTGSGKENQKWAIFTLMQFLIVIIIIKKLRFAPD